MSEKEAQNLNTEESIVLPKKVLDLAPVQWVNESNIIGKYFNMFLNDITFRGRLSLLQGMGANFVVSIYKIVLGFIYGSIWFLTVGIYYFSLLVIRGLLVKMSKRASEIKGNLRERQRLEWIGYQRTGILMLFLNGIIAAMVLFIAFGGETFYYPGHTIYLFAIILAYNMYWSTNSLLKTRHFGYPSLMATKAVNFCGAMMGTYALIAAIAAQLKDGYIIQGTTLVIVLGMAITVLEMAMALFMVVNGTVKRIRLSKKQMVD